METIQFLLQKRHLFTAFPCTNLTTSAPDPTWIARVWPYFDSEFKSHQIEKYSTAPSHQIAQLGAWKGTPLQRSLRGSSHHPDGFFAVYSFTARTKLATAQPPAVSTCHKAQVHACFYRNHYVY